MPLRSVMTTFLVEGILFVAFLSHRLNHGIKMDGKIRHSTFSMAFTLGFGGWRVQTDLRRIRAEY